MNLITFESNLTSPWRWLRLWGRCKAQLDLLPWTYEQISRTSVLIMLPISQALFFSLTYFFFVLLELLFSLLTTVNLLLLEPPQSPDGRSKTWSDGCATCVSGRQIDFLRVDNSAMVAALGESGKREIEAVGRTGQWDKRKRRHDTMHPWGPEVRGSSLIAGVRIDALFAASLFGSPNRRGHKTSIRSALFSNLERVIFWGSAVSWNLYLFIFLQHIELLEKGDKHSQPFKKVISALRLLPSLLRSASISKKIKIKLKNQLPVRFSGLWNKRIIIIKR